jgi:hypothetical protein
MTRQQRIVALNRKACPALAVHFAVRTPTRTIRRMPEIEQMTLTSPVRVRDMPHHPTADSFDSLRPRQAGGHQNSTWCSGPDHEVRLNQPAIICRARRGACRRLAEFLVAEGSSTTSPKRAPAVRQGRPGSAGVETTQVVALKDRME